MVGNEGPEREVRIAVVMYGGTSLAIYMNGIAQELLQLVRATSPHAAPGEALAGTARVYRRLAHVMAGTPLEALDEARLEQPPKVRFVIDILSGTSAGGINAVMLAKALARNASLAPLQTLWLEQGALDRLLNDPAGATRRTPYREPVRALFNSDRMYVELLRAMDALNPEDAGREPLVASLDLVVTGTDLSGERIDIRLADGVAQEYAHAHTFTFRLEEHLTDEFTSDHDPLLAFAARSTSSLPAAFEPAVAERARHLAGRSYRGRSPWRMLFRSLREGDEAEHQRRPFADGGYLDNKPFGHAIDLLERSSGSAEVTRKLYYLEPRPQRIDPDAPEKAVPNALGNTLQAFSLARYETIRADIRRLSERNRLIDRIRTLDAGVVEDLGVPASRAGADVGTTAAYEPGNQEHDGRIQGDPAARDADLSELVALHGPAYGGYHRLRVATVTDGIANLLADMAKVPGGSDARRALRHVVRAWRNDHFRRERTAREEPESAFLRRFDLAYHRRRARFLLAKVNQLFTLDPEVAGELEHVAAERERIGNLIEGFKLADEERTAAAWAEQAELLSVCKTIALRAAYALDAPADPADEVAASLEAVYPADDRGARNAVRTDLLAILAEPREEASRQAAERFYRDHRTRLLELAASLERDIAGRIATAEEALRDLAALRVVDELGRELRALLLRYAQRYIHFDIVRFPLLEAAQVGEELSPVAVHRISPADVELYGDAFGEPKLKGARFASFGAFLDRRWREHDIRWGRLDGAERIIASMLDDDPTGARQRLTLEAHLAILEASFPADQDALRAIGGRFARGDAARGGATHASERPDDRSADGDPTRGVDQAVTGQAFDRAQPERAQPERARLDRARLELRDFLRQKAAGLELRPASSARQLSRLVRVSGKLSDSLTTDAKLPGLVRNTLAATAWAGSALLDTVIPKSFGRLLGSYWANLAMLIGTVLIVLALPIFPWPRAHGTVAPGVVLLGLGVAFVLGRGLLWSALSPPVTAPDSAGSALGAAGSTLGAARSTLGAAGSARAATGPGTQASRTPGSASIRVRTAWMLRRFGLVAFVLTLACLVVGFAFEVSMRPSSAVCPGTRDVPAATDGAARTAGLEPPTGPERPTALPAAAAPGWFRTVTAVLRQPPAPVRLGLTGTPQAFGCAPLADAMLADRAADATARAPSLHARALGATWTAVVALLLFLASFAAASSAAPAGNAGTRWLRPTGIIWAAATLATGSWLAVRLLAWLYRGGPQPVGSELPSVLNGDLTRIVLLLAFAGTALLAPLIVAPARHVPFTMRTLCMASSILAVAAAALGIVALTLDLRSLLGTATYFAAVALLALEALLAAGLFGARRPTRSLGA